MAGVMSLMQGPQGQQGPMPGQAQQQPMPGMMPQQGAATPASYLAPLKGYRSDQLKVMVDQKPSWALLTAYNEALKQEKLSAAGQGQQAQMAAATNQGRTVADDLLAQQPPMAQAPMQQEPVMAAYGGEMHGYAGGGAVSFAEGGRTFGYAPDYELARKYGIDLSPYDSPSVRQEKIKRARAMADFEEQRKSFGDIPTEASVANDQALQQAYASPSRAQDVLQKGIAAVAPARPPAPAPMQPTRRPPAGNKPPAMSQGLGGLMSGVEQTGTPGPDTLSDIESKGIAANKAYQDVLRQQGTVDPRLAELREAAYKSSQGIAERRERDRLAALEAAQKQYADPTDLLIGFAGGAGGRTALEVLSGAVKGGAAARTTKRAELQKAQELSSQQQKANEDLTQALAEKRVADMTGDVNQRREADRKVAEAELKVTDLRSGIQQQRATEEDRAEQRRLTERGQNVQQQTAREQIAAQLQSAKIGAAAREGREGLAEQRLALQAMRADPNYAAVVKELTEAKKMAGVSTSPTLQTRLKAAEKAARDLASSYGVTPGMMGMGGAGAPAPAGDATTRLRFDAQGNPIK